MRVVFASFSLRKKLGFIRQKSYIYIILLAFLPSCLQKPPQPEQAWGELKKLGQNLQHLREQAGRFDKNKENTLSLHNYPDAWPGSNRL